MKVPHTLNPLSPAHLLKTKTKTTRSLGRDGRKDFKFFELFIKIADPFCF